MRFRVGSYASRQADVPKVLYRATRCIGKTSGSPFRLQEPDRRKYHPNRSSDRPAGIRGLQRFPPPQPCSKPGPESGPWRPLPVFPRGGFRASPTRKTRPAEKSRQGFGVFTCLIRAEGACPLHVPPAALPRRFSTISGMAVAIRPSSAGPPARRHRDRGRRLAPCRRCCTTPLVGAEVDGGGAAGVRARSAPGRGALVGRPAAKRRGSRDVIQRCANKAWSAPADALIEPRCERNLKITCRDSR